MESHGDHVSSRRNLGPLNVCGMIGAEERALMMAGPRAPTDGPSGGISASLDQAKAAFRAAPDAPG